VNDLIKKLADKASDAGALARSISESGIQSVSEMFSGISPHFAWQGVWGA
jgi:hypothetical protein